MNLLRAKAKHPNRVPFEGVLTRLDRPSDLPPGGSRGHRTILIKAAAEEALHTLDGMPLDFKAGSFDGHDKRLKCGVITDAWILGDELYVSGHTFLQDFEDLATALRNPDIEFGLSFEMTDVHVVDMRPSIWTLRRFTFCGAAVLLRDKAAYTTSSFKLLEAAAAAAAEEPFTGRMTFESFGGVQLNPSRHGGVLRRLHFDTGRFRLIRRMIFRLKTARFRGREK